MKKCKKVVTLLVSAALAMALGLSAVTVAAESIDIWELIEITSQKVPFENVNENDPIEGGTLRVAAVSNSSFSGVLDPLFTDTTLDADAAAFMVGGLFTLNESVMWGNDGIARFEEWCHDTQSVLIAMNEVVFWHDGVQLTLDDLVFAYEVIAHPDYTGIRWGDTTWNVVGAREFRAGEADYISGFELSEDAMELRIHFVDWSPVLQFGGAFWTTPAPRHHLQDIPVAELAAHENVRGNTLGFGPFILEAQVPGEEYIFVRNDDFWLGTPGVERVSVRIIPPPSVPLEVQAGNFDIVSSFPISQFVNFPDPDNFQFVGRLNPNTSWHYVFNLGYFDPEIEGMVLQEDATLADPALRRAISHIFPIYEVGQALFSGLSIPQPNTLNMQHSAFFLPDFSFHNFDPELAVQILDEAGYEIGPDGWRTNPDGSELVFYLLWQLPGSPAAEMNLQMHLQSAHDVGLNMQLYQGVAHDFQVFVEILNTPGPAGWDIVSSGWGGGANPNPSEQWGPTIVNRSGWFSPRFEEIQNTINTDPRMWDMDFMIETYHEWQRAFYEEIPAAVGSLSVQLWGINNRVRNFSVRPASEGGVIREPMMGNWWLIELTSDEPYVAQ